MLSNSSKALCAGLTAHFIWGGSALYWTLLTHLSATTILAHRMLWSCCFAFVLILLTKNLKFTFDTLRDSKSFLLLFACSASLSTNWGMFIWAVNNGYALELSLGYYITPLINVLMGRVLLKEACLDRLQTFAVCLAFFAVCIRILIVGSVPYIPLFLAVTFAFYGFLHKKISLPAPVGLFIETLFATPFALAWLIIMEPGSYGIIGYEFKSTALLLASVVFTAIPLLCFSYATRYLSLTNIGFLQYVSPSITFLIAIFILKNPVTIADYCTFPLIWLALAIYTWDIIMKTRHISKNKA